MLICTIGSFANTFLLGLLVGAVLIGIASYKLAVHRCTKRDHASSKKH